MENGLSLGLGLGLCLGLNLGLGIGVSLGFGLGMDVTLGLGLVVSFGSSLLKPKLMPKPEPGPGMLTMHFARQTLSDIETTHQAGKAIKTPNAFRTTCVDQERHHGGVRSTLHLAQFCFSRKT